MMEIEKRNAGDSITFALKGRLDTVSAPAFEPQLKAALNETNKLVLDFQELVYVSSAGLRLILMAYKSESAKGGEFKLIHVSNDVKEILSMTGFDSFLTIE